MKHLITVLLLLTVHIAFAQSFLGSWQPCATIDKNGKYLMLFPAAVYDAEIKKQKKLKAKPETISMLEINKILCSGFITSVGVVFYGDSTCTVKTSGYNYEAKYIVDSKQGKIFLNYSDGAKQEWNYSFTKSKELKITNFYYPGVTFYFKKK